MHKALASKEVEKKTGQGSRPNDRGILKVKLIKDSEEELSKRES